MPVPLSGASATVIDALLDAFVAVSWWTVTVTVWLPLLPEQAAKVAHIKAHPQISLNLDSDGDGGGIIVVGGTAAIDATGVDCRDDEPYWAKYRDDAAKFGLTEAMSSYSTRLAITPTKVWTTPTG